MSEHLKTYKCPNCSGQITFNPTKQKLVCEFCEGSFDAENFSEAKNYTFNADTYQNTDNINVYVCHNCGGSVYTDTTTAATKCPYCDSNMVISKNIEGLYKPKSVIPFKLNKAQAMEKYAQHLQHKVLLPKLFKQQAIVDEVKGLYVPFFLFSGKGNGKMWFNATKVRHYSDSTYNYTETNYYKLFRSGSVRFKNVPVDASSKIDDKLTQSIEPFNNKEMIDFNDNYLVGYLADKYDVEAESCQNISKDRMKESTRRLLESTTIGYTTVVPSFSSFDVLEGQQDYVMYPLWMLNVSYKKKKYTFVMNGQTGKFVGNLPIDAAKLTIICVLTLLIAFGLTIFIQYLIVRGR